MRVLFVILFVLPNLSIAKENLSKGRKPNQAPVPAATVRVVYGDRITFFQVYSGPAAGRVELTNNAGLNRTKMTKKTDADFIVAKVSSLPAVKMDKTKCQRRFIETFTNNQFKSYCYEDSSTAAVDAQAIANLLSAVF